MTADGLRPFYEDLGLNIETYDLRAVQEGMPTEGDTAFYIEEARKWGSPVLELGCGTGRVTWPVAEAGCEIVGLDLSAPMIHVALAKASAYPASVCERVKFVRGDMRDFQLDGTFPTVLIPFRTFQSLLTPEDQRRCLACVKKHLAKEGRLIIDLFDPRLDYCHAGTALERQLESVIHPRTGNRVETRIENHINDPLAQMLTEDWCFTEIDKNGKKVREEKERLAMRWIYRQEARYLFELCGYEIEAEFSDFSRSPPAYGKEQVWVLRNSGQ